MKIETPVIRTAWLLVGFATAVALRMLLGGIGVARSVPAGLAFAVCLLVLGVVTHTSFTVSRRAVWLGLVGAAVLCLPAVAARLLGTGPHVPAGNFVSWAAVVSLVAFAEEYFLRGALFNASSAWLGDLPAVAITAVAFAALHLPLYGWPAIPLDLAAGVWLGALRVVARNASAPAIAHILADLAGWWLR